jgi:hypothetical protein
LLNAPAYPAAITISARNRAPSTPRLVIAARVERKSPTNVRPCSHPRHTAGWRINASSPIRVQLRVADPPRTKSVRSTASTKPG